MKLSVCGVGSAVLERLVNEIDQPLQKNNKEATLRLPNPGFDCRKSFPAASPTLTLACQRYTRG
jgi:hypothetical protein